MTRGNFPTAQGEIAGAADTETRGQVGLHFRFREGCFALAVGVASALQSSAGAEGFDGGTVHMPCARYLDFGKDATFSSIRRVQERLLSTYSRHRAKQAQSAPVSIDPFDIANTHRRFDLDQREQRAMMRFLVVTHLEAGVWAGEQLVAPCSPYLLRPLRTFRQACSDISASHPELLLPEFDAYTNIETSTMHDYTLAIKNKGRPPKSWRWEIYEAGKNKPVRQSEFFETMSEATRTGKTALAELRANRAA